jgi:hypothetical protein
MRARLGAADGKGLVDNQVHTDRDVGKLLQVAGRINSAARTRCGRRQGLEVQRAVRPVVVDHLPDLDVDIRIQRDLGKAALDVLVKDLRVSRVLGWAKQAGHNGDCPEPGEKSEQGHCQ